MPGLDLLQKVWFFDGFTDKQLKTLDSCCQMADYAKGDRLFKVRDEANYFFIILEGRVDLKVDPPRGSGGEAHTITTIRKNQVFGWSALTHSPIYSLSAYCSTKKLKLIKVDRKCVLALCEKDTRMGYVLMGNLAEVISTRFEQLQQDTTRKQGHGTY